MNYLYLLMNSAPTPDVIAGSFLLQLYYGNADRNWPGIPNARLEFLSNADDVNEKYFGKTLFLGVANSCRRTLLDGGVKEADIIDACGADDKGRMTRSLFSSLLERMKIQDEQLHCLAKVLSAGGENYPPFHVANILKAIYDAKEDNVLAGVNWWMETLCAIYTDKRFFQHTNMETLGAVYVADLFSQRDDRIPRAGIFFEKVACMWALYRNRPSEEMRIGLLKRYFPMIGEGEKPDFKAVLKSIGKENDPKLAKIRTFVSDHCSKMPGLLSLPRLMHCLANERGLENAIIRSFEALDAKRAEQIEFLEAVAIVQSEETMVRDVTVKGKPAVALHVISDNRKIDAAANWVANQKQANLAVVLQERPSGNPMIFAGARSEVRLAGVARRIREAILEHYGAEDARLSNELLEAPGVTCGLSEVVLVLKHEDGTGSDKVLGATRSYPKATSWPRSVSIAQAKQIIVEEIDESRPAAKKPASAEKKIKIRRRRQPATIAA